LSASTSIRNRDGSEVWLVALKASFDIRPDGSLVIADEQDPVTLAPAFVGDPSISSLAHEADIVWARPGTDVFVRGSAHAPAGPVQHLRIGFRVGPVQRTAVVIGDRVWERGLLGTLHPSEAVAFTSMPVDLGTCLRRPRSGCGSHELGSAQSGGPRICNCRALFERFGPAERRRSAAHDQQRARSSGARRLRSGGEALAATRTLRRHL
jgi:hypothetical protein